MAQRSDGVGTDLGLLVIRLGVGAMFVTSAGLTLAGGGRFALGHSIPGLKGKWFG